MRAGGGGGHALGGGEDHRWHRRAVGREVVEEVRRELRESDGRSGQGWGGAGGSMRASGVDRGVFERNVSLQSERSVSDL